MAGRSVKLFLYIQKLYHVGGICLPQPNQILSNGLHEQLNWKNWMFLFFEIKSLLIALAFLMIEAESVLGFGMCVYYTACLILGLTLYLALIQQSRNIPHFIENCEAFIEKSM